MSVGDINLILRDGIRMVLMLALPLLGSALTVGLVVAILQATTSIQEQTLTFVPKMFVILSVVFFLGGLGFGLLGNYTEALFRQIPAMVR